jgi:MGT family glycosyltransferase
VTLLVISPDYASHVVPLLSIARAWHARGQRVVIATGDAVAPLVATAGFEHERLVMSRGSNGGIARASTVPAAEARSLAAFFAATRRGMVETLHFQSEARAIDLLWQPLLVARRTMGIVERVRPDAVVVDHLAFSATIGLRALGAPYADVVLGHPTALPVGDEVYGVPSAWPAGLRVDPLALADLRQGARRVSAAFSEAYRGALHALAPSSEPVDDAFRSHGRLVLYNYPADLHPPQRSALLPVRHAFLGSLVRDETPDDEASEWLARGDRRPLVVVSFGTFLSARADVLSRVAGALRRLDVRVAMAVGDQPPASLGPLPVEWFVRDRLPQVALLRHADLLVTHGGNNSVTEALTHGVPMVALPFSTDQFDAAAAIERHLVGLALDPNHASRPLIAGSVRGLVEKPPAQIARLCRRLRAVSGPELAYQAMSAAGLLPV